MRVTPAGNNQGYGQGPQTERAHRDPPKRQRQQQRDGGNRQPGDDGDSVELGKKGAGDTKPKGSGTTPPRPRPVPQPPKPSLDLSA